MDFLGKFLQPWRLFNSTSCKKSNINHFHSKMWNFCVHPTPNFLERDWHPEILVNLDHVLLVVREKSKNETVATFYDVYGVFGSKMISFSLLRSDWKSFSFLKQKWKRFVKENPPKWKMDHFCSISTQISSSEMKPVFWCFASRNLAQTRTLGDILLYVLFLTLENFPPFHFYL